MSDFCKQCSIDMFGEDTKDFAKLTTAKDDVEQVYALVICEGCGPSTVDSSGQCISFDCYRKHGEQVFNVGKAEKM